jgi:hypothetical protein
MQREVRFLQSHIPYFWASCENYHPTDIDSDTLSKTKIPGSENIQPLDKLQDDTHNLVADQVGKGGILQPLGDMAGKEGVNRMERGGKDDKGKWIPGGAGKQIVDPISGGVKSGANAVGGLFGGKK